ncbi:MAG: hypothetical protein A2Z29_05215 [Chloroflexi bacterium RBG_16_56_11]|nr:MAG: hypothetical protein A2Z29_05215 [Chloroflexi bacterium RBG_16_56_11]
MIKKLLFISFAVILVSMIVFVGCGEPEETATSAPPATTPAATTPAATTPTSAEPTPVTGGILRAIAGAIPKNLGYGPEKAPNDNYQMLPVIERLCEWDEKGNVIPWLAESWDVDTTALTLTWHLRKGVKFHDGTDWNAEALRWNYQMGIDTKRLADAAYVKSLEVVDANTLRMHLTGFNWVLIENFGLLMQPISPTAFEKAGGGDIEKSKAWARLNAVGTGPFTVSEFQRDVVIKFTRNPNYWQPGKPYLDGIELRYIPDPMVAAATMEAGEADMWFDVSAVQNLLDLQKKGFKINWGPGMFQCMLFDSANPESPFANKKVREAVEYAIDRPAIAGMLGQGLYEPLHQMASKTWPGYIEGYDPRPYNVAKAKQLLAEAGLPTGFKTTILLSDAAAARDAVAALQAYLGEVGITVEPDVADLGRYFGSVFGTGYKNIVFTASGINPSTTDLYTHFGPRPVTFRTGNMYKSPEFLAKCEAALDPKYMDKNQALPGIKEAVRQAGEDAMLIPLWRTPNSAIMMPYVHSNYFLIHGIIWTPVDDWMEKH